MQTNYNTNCEAVILDMHEDDMNYSCTLVPKCGFVGKNSTSILFGALQPYMGNYGYTCTCISVFGHDSFSLRFDILCLDRGYYRQDRRIFTDGNCLVLDDPVEKYVTLDGGCTPSILSMCNDVMNCDNCIVTL